MFKFINYIILLQIKDITKYLLNVANKFLNLVIKKWIKKFVHTYPFR